MLNHTHNETTTVVGQCVATVLVHCGNLYTVELVYPRIIHSEFMTHRMFSRNALSSRATPLMETIRALDEEIYTPALFLKNQSGMVGGEPFDDNTQEELKREWQECYEQSRAKALKLYTMGVHKQFVNRLLEPFSFIKVLVTATDWDNFFKLRLAKDAQPEIQDLANAIKGAQEKACSMVIPTVYPYVDPESTNWDMSILAFVSASRCARLSYYKHDGKSPTLEDDIKLSIRLLESGHMTPFEHQCFHVETMGDIFNLDLDPEMYYANLNGFLNMRYLLEQGIIPKDTAIGLLKDYLTKIN